MAAPPQVTSQRVVSQLKVMALRAVATSGFNRQVWAAQLGPLLRLWDQLMGQASGLRQAGKEARQQHQNQQRAAGSGGGGAPAVGSPLDNFVALERLHGAGLVAAVDRTMAALARVLKGADTLSGSVQVRCALCCALCCDGIG